MTQKTEKKIYVGNLAYTTTANELQDAFAKFGNITSVKLIEDRETGRSKGFAFIEFENDDSAKNALELNGSQLADRTIRVSIAEPRSTGGGNRRRGGGGAGGGAGGGGGYNRAW